MAVLLGVKTGDRSGRSASVIKREFVACGVCLYRRSCKFMAKSLGQVWFASQSIPIDPVARYFDYILRFSELRNVHTLTAYYYRLNTSTLHLDPKHFTFEFAKVALDSLDSTVITQTFRITAQSLKVLPNSFPPAVQTSSCYTYTRILRLIFVSRIHARLFLSCTEKIAKVGSAP
jgi:hypothetical protein